MQQYTDPEHLLRNASPNEVRTVVEQLLPEPQLRASCLDALANAVQVAHATQPGGWGITLSPTSLKLHVGLREVFCVIPPTIELAIDRHSMDANQLMLEDVQYFTMVYDRPTKHDFVEVRYEVCAISQARFPVYYALLRPAHQFAIAEAAREPLWDQARRNHAAGVLDYLRDVLTRGVPHPGVPGPVS